MGWGVRVGTERARVLSDDFSYTFNVAPLFFALFPLDSGGIRGLNGKSVAEASAAIWAALECARRMPAEQLAGYEPPNGFGSVAGALGFLDAIKESCDGFAADGYPEATVCVT